VRFLGGEVSSNPKKISILIVDGNDFVLLELGFQNIERKVIIDAWFEKFNVSIYINILLLF